MQNWRDLPIFPVAFALYPVLHLYSTNAAVLEVEAIWRSVGVMIVTLALTWALLGWIVHDSFLGGLMASTLLFLFFTYGPVHEVIKQVLEPVMAVRYRYTAPMWGLLMVIVFVWIVKQGNALRPHVRTMNAMAIVLAVLPVFSLATRNLQAHAGTDSTVFEVDPVSIVETRLAEQPLPDIYFIVLDGYARNDVLLDQYGFDNQAFTDGLTRRGFYVAEDSHSNYTLTFLSLASTLNMEYLNHRAGLTASAVFRTVDDSRVLREVRARGYTFIQLASGIEPTDHNPFADIEIRPGILNQFEAVLLRSTLVYPLLKFDEGRAVILSHLETLGRSVEWPGPKFVFAHLVIPHPPFLFDREGHPVDTLSQKSGDEAWTEQRAYVEQVEFINWRVMDVIDRILSASRTPPVIIVQADHGSALTGAYGGWQRAHQALANGHPDAAALAFARERLSILNAVYLPEGRGADELYSSITPVNTFRLILDNCLGTSLGQLDDRSYLSTYEDFFAFVEVSASQLGASGYSLSQLDRTSFMHRRQE